MGVGRHIRTRNWRDMRSGILRKKLVKLVTLMRDSQSVSRVLATCAVAMCSLALRKFLHLSEFFLVIADSSTSYLTNCSDFPKMGMFAIVAEGY